MRGMARPYILLATVAVLAITAQTTYTVDVLRYMNGEYPANPFGMRGPWPSIRWLHSSGETAGLRIGDRVIAIDGRPPQGLADLASAVRGREPGADLPVSVERDGKPAEYHVRIAAVGGHPRWYYAIVVWFLMPWLSILLGLWVAAVRARDPLAWLVLGILLGLSQITRAGVLDPLGWPPAIGVSVQAFRAIAQPTWAICMLLFGIYFPQRWTVDRRVPWVKWVLLAPAIVFGLLTTARVVAESVSYRALSLLPQEPQSDTGTFVLQALIISVFFVGLSSKYQDPSLACDERRRLKLLYWGCSAAMTPLFLVMVYGFIVYHRPTGDSGGIAIAAAMMAVILFPLTMAYVIVVQRAMDVRMVIRQGVQYALARRGIRLIQAALMIAVVFVAASVLDSTHVSRPQRLIFVALGTVVALRIRDLGEHLRRWVDRRFFREAYKAEQILSDLSEQVRSILDRDTLLQTVARKIAESLHVDRVAVLLRDGGVFRPALARGYPAPLDLAISAESPAVQQLLDSDERPPSDRLPQLDSQLLLPLSSRKELLGFISLGPKKSEEPYSPTDTSLLRSVAAQTGLALENARLSEAIAEEVAQRELLHREIEIAREVQQRLFPQSLPEVAALDYAGHCRPARGVGGDYYDFLALASGRLGLAIGDVSGKGIPAALLMASLQASVRGQSQSASGNIAELMSNVNRLVCDATPENRYATFFYGQFDPATRRLIYVNGGHNPPILLRGAEVLRLEKGGPPIGLFRFSRYEQDEIDLLPGDLLVLFTDGISEAENSSEEEWGEAALIETARACSRFAPAETISRIMRAADAFASGAPQHDDMTLVVARVLPE